MALKIRWYGIPATFRKCPSAIFHIIKPSLRDFGATASTFLMLHRRISSVEHALPLEMHYRW
jgi:hypothetical protein